MYFAPPFAQVGCGIPTGRIVPTQVALARRQGRLRGKSDHLLDRLFPLRGALGCKQGPLTLRAD